ncbi:hypothetical protein AN1V17_28510 [Vallitalea sediminicola]
MNIKKLKIFSTIICVLTLSLVCQISSFAANLGDSVGTDTTFQVNDYLLSQNGQYKAHWQQDGNFVVYNSDLQPLWASNTMGSGVRCSFEDSGNLVIRDHEISQKIIVSNIDPYDNYISHSYISVYKNENPNTVKERVLTDIHIVDNMIIGQKYEWVIVSKTSNANTRKARIITYVSETPFGKINFIEDIIDVPKNEVIWSSHIESGYTGSNVLIMQNDGNLVIYDENNNPVWATGTVQ